jgi:hypothetical protein
MRCDILKRASIPFWDGKGRDWQIYSKKFLKKIYLLFSKNLLPGQTLILWLVLPAIHTLPSFRFFEFPHTSAERYWMARRLPLFRPSGERQKGLQSSVEGFENESFFVFT